MKFHVANKTFVLSDVIYGHNPMYFDSTSSNYFFFHQEISFDKIEEYIYDLFVRCMWSMDISVFVYIFV